MSNKSLQLTLLLKQEIFNGSNLAQTESAIG